MVLNYLTLNATLIGNDNIRDICMSSSIDLLVDAHRIFRPKVHIKAAQERFILFQVGFLDVSRFYRADA